MTLGRMTASGPRLTAAALLLVGLLGWVQPAVVHGQQVSGCADYLKQSGGAFETFADKPVLTTQSANRNLQNFMSSYPNLCQVAQSVVTDLDAIASEDLAARLTRQSVPASVSLSIIKDRDEFVDTIEGANKSWAPQQRTKYGAKEFAIRVTMIPVHDNKGLGLSRSAAMRHFVAMYHDATSFANRPDYDAESMKATEPHEEKVLFYHQEVSGYVFATQEMFDTEWADFMAMFWPLRKRSYGIDLAVLLPGEGDSVSHIAFITVYDDPDRSSGEVGDTASQHRVLLRQIRRNQ